MATGPYPESHPGDIAFPTTAPLTIFGGMASTRPKRIYALFDSVHDNTGDRAVGEALALFAAAHDAELVSLNPLDPRAIEGVPEPVIVGGGELIHPVGDPFYDSFRLSGRHLLNTAGITTNKGLEFLADYAYVSVRSSLDKQLLADVRPDAEVAPCIAAALDPTSPPEEPPQGTVLVHVHFNMAHHIPSLAEVLDELGREYPLRWISLTPYAGDKATMYRIGAGMKDPPVLDRADAPRQKIGVISKARLLICASLHGAIFAHSQNVPFLVYAQPPKIKAFLEDRGLQELGFVDEKSLRAALERVLANPPNFSASVARDREALSRHLERMAEELQLPRRRKRLSQGRVDRKSLFHETQTALFDRVALQQAYKELEALSLQSSSLLKLRDAIKDYQRELQTWQKIAHDYEADRDRWKERCLAAEAALQNERAHSEMLGHINHTLVQMTELMRRQQETRLSERSLKLFKRVARGVLGRLPQSYSEPVRGVAERVLGRPIAPFNKGPSVSDEATRVHQERVHGAAGSHPCRESRYRRSLKARISEKNATEGAAGEGRAGEEQRGHDRIAITSRAGVSAAPRRKLLGPLSVCIPTYNAGAELVEVLEAVARQRGVKVEEVLVVDSSSEDGTADLARRWGATVEVIDRSSFNHGTTRNHLAELAQSPYLLFLTQDALLGSAESMASMIEMLDSERELAAVSARQVPRSNADLFGAYTCFSHSRALGLDRDMIFPDPSHGEDRYENPLARVPRETLRLWASVDNVCAAYKREAWERIRFRERSFAEDLDFGIRALEQGWKIGYCHSAPVVHSHDRPALYHLRRHIADKLFVDPILNAAGSSDGGSKAGPSAELSEEVEPAVERELAATVALCKALSSGVAICASSDRIVRLPDRIAETREVAASFAAGEASRIGWALDAHAARGTSGGASASTNEGREVEDVVRWLKDTFERDPRYGCPEVPGRAAGEYVDVAIALGSHMTAMLASPLLDDFVQANRHASSRAAGQFVVRLCSAGIGAYLGQVLARLPETHELRRRASSGI